MRRLRVGVAGLGGFAAEHHAALAALQAEGRCEVVATCDPFRPPGRTDAGVPIFGSLEEMIASGPFDVITLPTPIPLHREQHRQVVEAGIACYLEKPPSLWSPEYRLMLRAQESAKKKTMVGFNFVGDPMRHTMRDRVGGGEFGRLRELRFAAVWPRDHRYYERNNWAGRTLLGGQPVLDSPMGNACAHYVQNLLFWTQEPIEFVAASRWRAHEIESFDTVFLRAKLRGDAVMRLAITHTAGDIVDPAPARFPSWEPETLVFERATIRFANWREAKIQWTDGRIEERVSGIADGRQMLIHNLRQYLQYVAGEIERPLGAFLVESEALVALNTLAHLGPPIGELDGVENGGYRMVDGIEASILAFVDEGRWPAWGSEPPEVPVSDLP
jgi:predicted dehydrogenase